MRIILLKKKKEYFLKNKFFKKLFLKIVLFHKCEMYIDVSGILDTNEI